MTLRISDFHVAPVKFHQLSTAALDMYTICDGISVYRLLRICDMYNLYVKTNFMVYLAYGICYKPVTTISYRLKHLVYKLKGWL